MTAFTDFVDLAAERVGGKALACSDEFFAEKENLLKPGRGVFIADKYTDNGKWMDGWESRRKRVPGHDWCIIRLGMPGIIRGFDVDTNHFTGNYPEHVSIDACETDSDAGADKLKSATWTELVPIKKLEGGSQNLFEVLSDKRWTHVRLNIHPDGGVARLRVHGEVLADWPALKKAGATVDLGAMTNGAVVALCNDNYFGKKDNLILPGTSTHMGDGWETRRRRGPGNDWTIVRLGAPGTLERVELDTTHFKGNFPDSFALEGAKLSASVPNDQLASRAIAWEPILPQTKLSAHATHKFEKELLAKGPYSHVRLSIFPDGGVARLRLFGKAV